jgi:NAD(P)-dependent dehydrogenase (short-subunit alcohol dehydrogenase family)
VGAGADQRLAGKAALIVGASRGIGAAAAAAFVRHGARVVIAARSREPLTEVADRLNADGYEVHAIQADVAHADSIRAAVEFATARFGRLDIAFNNAAINPVRTPFHELAEHDYDQTLDINLKGVFVAMQAEIRAMLACGGGSIINTASAAGFVAMPMMAGYVASKHGVIGLTRAAAVEYAARKIRVNAVAPGAVLTEMLLAGTGATAEGRARIEAVTPMRRIGAPEEIADAVVWLASDQSSFVTGATIPVDGGYILP